MNLIDEAGLRKDGRRPLEPREVRCKVDDGASTSCDGSAIFEIGNTKVAVQVKGPQAVSKRSDEGDKGVVRARCELAPFARGQRRTDPRRRDLLCADIERCVVETLSEAVQLTLIPGSEVFVNLNLLQIDGGGMPAAVNAAALGLAHAGVPMVYFVAAGAATYVDGHALCDPTATEVPPSAPEALVASGGEEMVVTALVSGRAMPMERADKAMELAEACASKCRSEMRKELLDDTMRRVCGS